MEPPTRKPINVYVGNNIRRHREEQKISQAELAFRGDLHQNYIGQIERAEKNISLQNLERIAKALGVPIADLLI